MWVSFHWILALASPRPLHFHTILLTFEASKGPMYFAEKAGALCTWIRSLVLWWWCIGEQTRATLAPSQSLSLQSQSCIALCFSCFCCTHPLCFQPHGFAIALCHPLLRSAFALVLCRARSLGYTDARRRNGRWKSCALKTPKHCRFIWQHFSDSNTPMNQKCAHFYV